MFLKCKSYYKTGGILLLFMVETEIVDIYHGEVLNTSTFMNQKSIVVPYNSTSIEFIMNEFQSLYFQIKNSEHSFNNLIIN